MSELFIIQSGLEKQKLFDHLQIRQLPFKAYIDDYNQIRSIPQNNYLWVCYQYVADFTGYNCYEVHMLFKFLFLPTKVISLFDFLSGSSTGLSLSEFQAYIASIKHYALIELGVVIPEPEQVSFSPLKSENANHSR